MKARIFSRLTSVWMAFESEATKRPRRQSVNELTRGGDDLLRRAVRSSCCTSIPGMKVIFHRTAPLCPCVHRERLDRVQHIQANLDEVGHDLGDLATAMEPVLHPVAVRLVNQVGEAGLEQRAEDPRLKNRPVCVPISSLV